MIISHLDSIDQIADIVLLILTVCHVVARPDGQKTDIHFGRFLQRRGNGNRSALPGVIRIPPVDCSRGLGGRFEIRMFGIAEPGFGSVEECDSEFVGGV